MIKLLEYYYPVLLQMIMVVGLSFVIKPSISYWFIQGFLVGCVWGLCRVVQKRGTGW